MTAEELARQIELEWLSAPRIVDYRNVRPDEKQPAEPEPEDD